MLPVDRIRELLTEHDDPRQPERPRDFDPEAAARRFARLTDALRHRFGPSCRADLWQDAGVYGSIVVPAEADGADGRLWVGLSNFGGFVTARTGTGGGAPEEAEGPGDAFVTWLDEVCTAAGCVLVPWALLLERYEGPTPTPSDGDRAFLDALAAAGYDVEGEEVTPPVWADRYFDYV
ncbi:hypothetical protein [Streptomyces parvulus]|uniref:hypothetical protein n=1 Tax=Streptomyces parvulus TaxID=146923 RepID=UPI00369D5B77